MPVVSEVRAADNRRRWHESRIANEQSPRVKLRHAVEWVVAEARHMDGVDVEALAGEIRDVARLLNERSRL
ncbi:hypothetical protein K1W54_04440 [Micromonospora sp. CPCC 205371]|nr:hypothetical protein [Micromonospora sp. CPCC 205371]